jgi:hypothetical protein
MNPLGYVPLGYLRTLRKLSAVSGAAFCVGAETKTGPHGTRSTASLSGGCPDHASAIPGNRRFAVTHPRAGKPHVRYCARRLLILAPIYGFDLSSGGVAED